MEPKASTESERIEMNEKYEIPSPKKRPKLEAKEVDPEVLKSKQLIITLETRAMIVGILPSMSLP